MTQAVQLAADRADIELIRGDDLSLVITTYDINGAVVDITGATVSFTVKSGVGGTQIFNRATGGSGITLTDATNGVFTIAIAPTQTSSSNPGINTYDCQMTLSSLVTTVLRGKFTILGDVV